MQLCLVRVLVVRWQVCVQDFDTVVLSSYYLIEFNLIDFPIFVYILVLFRIYCIAGVASFLKSQNRKIKAVLADPPVCELFSAINIRYEIECTLCLSNTIRKVDSIKLTRIALGPK